MINAIKSKKYLIIGSGDAMKSLIHVNDIASFIICSEGREGIYNCVIRTFNIFSNNTVNM